jgi:hypothetical protein
MTDKHEARLSYYEGVRQAMLKHFEATEDGLRKLEGVKLAKIEKLIPDLRKRHDKLLTRVDRQIKLEKKP